MDNADQGFETYETSGNIGQCLKPKLALNMIKMLWEESFSIYENPYILAFIDRHNEQYDGDEEMQIDKTKNNTDEIFIACMIAEMCLDDNF